MNNRNLTLLTDLYELTMMQGYFERGDNETVVFDMFFRSNPNQNGYSIAAGLEQVIDYIKNLHFTYDDVAYLRSLKIFSDDLLTIDDIIEVLPKENNVDLSERSYNIINDWIGQNINKFKNNDNNEIYGKINTVMG